MNSTAAPAPVNSPKSTRCRGASRADSVADDSEKQPFAKGGTPYPISKRNFPLPPPPRRDGSPAKKEIPLALCWHRAHSSPNSRCSHGPHTNSTHLSKGGRPQTPWGRSARKRDSLRLWLMCSRHARQNRISCRRRKRRWRHKIAPGGQPCRFGAWIRQSRLVAAARRSGRG
jgi:hypothetical protein